MASDGSNFKSASDFFGADADGVDKFKTVAMRALLDQKMEEELNQVRLERDRLQKENATLGRDMAQLKQSMETNIDDRERVLAFKSKRIEELLIKAKEYEAINTSLLQTINGSQAELTEAGRNTRASNALLERGLPLFHAVETCKEQEYKRLWEEKKLHCEQLQQQIVENDALVREMRDFQHQKEEWASQVAAMEALVLHVTAEKDEKIHFLERKLVFEHDRLTREKDSEVAAHKQDMEKQLTLQLDSTTQRTIEENVRVQLELRYQSAQVERLIKQVDAISAENRQATHEKQLVSDMNALLSKKLKFYEQLFAKMQQHDQVKTKNQQRITENDARVSPTRRKPPLPSLSLGSTIGIAMQSAFDLFPSSPSPCPTRSRGDELNEDTLLHLDMASLDLLGEQLNSVASNFDAHMQKREFARKEVKAMLQYHDESPRYAESRASDDQEEKMLKKQSKRREMLPLKAYSPAKCPSRGPRQVRAAPLTLESFIQEHATISLRQNHGGTHGASSNKSPCLPTLLSPGISQPHRPPPRTDSTALWRAPPPRQPETDDEHHPLTARF